MRPGLRSRRIPPLTFAPLVLLLTAVAAERARVGMQSNSTARQHTAVPSSLTGAEPEQPLVWGDISRGHRALNAIDAQVAYESAKKYVLARLPGAARATARFDPWPAAGAASEHGKDGKTEIYRISPSRWRVRGTVSWSDGEGPARLTHERFETDLVHGPADDRWRLIDTEWLDANWMPDEHETRRD